MMLLVVCVCVTVDVCMIYVVFVVVKLWCVTRPHYAFVPMM